jgi:hypothetical protein
VVQAMTEPLARLRKQRSAPAIGVAAQGAVDANQSVSEAFAGLTLAGCKGRAANASRQGEGVAAVSRMVETVCALPILVEQIAVAQVGDAGATNGSDARERRTVWSQVEEGVKPVANTLERGALVRCAKEDEASQVFRPAVAGLGAVIVGTAATRPPTLWPMIANSLTGIGH